MRRRSIRDDLHKRRTGAQGSRPSCKSSFSGEGDPNNSSRPATQARNPAADGTRLQFLIRLGERPLFHFIDELERAAPLRETLEIYATLDPDFIKALGGDRFVPFFAIDGGAAQ